jgi:hypothetical protein
MTIDALQNALKTFHENKHVFVEAGIRVDFNIPKIHSMMHYHDSIETHGSLDGYNTESPERLHIEFAKDAYRASNKRQYVSQMTTWLSRQEAIARFDAYVEWLESESGTTQTPMDEGVTPGLDVERTGTHFTAKHPSYPHLDVETIMQDFRASQFLTALRTFICHYSPSPLIPVLPNEFDRFDAYKVLAIRLPDCPASGRFGELSRIYATRPVLGRNGCSSADEKGETNMVLVRREGQVNEGTRGTALDGASVVFRILSSWAQHFLGLQVAQVRLIFSLPDHLHQAHLPQTLAYVEWFTPFQGPHPDSRLYYVMRASHNRGPAVDVIPVDQILRSCHLIPRFGSHCPRAWTPQSVLERATSFFYNPYISLSEFCHFFNV